MDKEYIWYNDISKLFLERGYLLPNQSLDERVSIICERAEKILGMSGFAENFKANIKKGWYSLSSPIWSNFGTNRGLPISCFGSYVEDDMASILATHAEVGMMTKHGGGTSAYFGALRGRGEPITNNGDSSGSVHFMKMFEVDVNLVSQGSTRRGSFAAYLPIWHKDILEFLQIRSDGNPIQTLSFGVCVPDEWLQEMIDGDVKKREVWAKVIESRLNTGYPYILFTGNMNKNKPDAYLDQDMEIHSSNLCTEIMLPSNERESFVCDLSSMNIYHYDEWKDTDAVRLLTYFLDAVMTEFIESAKSIPFMERAVRFAQRHRALGIGWLGYHSYLQRNMIPFESTEAKFKNIEIAKNIKNQAWQASRELAHHFGEPPVLEGYGRRNTTLTAIAPTKSSSLILGQVSEGIEPYRGNYYTNDSNKIKFSVKNPTFKELLVSYNKDTKEIWDSILDNGGSVKHLDFLTDNEKDVFKTFKEISPLEVIIQASARQKYIDQSQSLNITVDPKTPTKDINTLYLEAWRNGVKSLYYQFSQNAAQQLTRSILYCSSCES